MEPLLISTCAAICIAVFAVFRIPLNRWTVPAASIGGIALVVALVQAMNFFHPYSNLSRQQFSATPVIPGVSGRVTEVAPAGNAMLEAGDLLFRIDAAPFRNRVGVLEARVKAARIELANAERQFQAKGASRGDVDLAAARLEDQQAQLAQAKIDLEQTVAVAPASGYATRVTLVPGMRATEQTPAMVFVHGEARNLVAWFHRSGLHRLDRGSPAEVTFASLPGEVFTGEVRALLPSAGRDGSVEQDDKFGAAVTADPSLVPVLIRITDSRFAGFASRVPLGAEAEAVVFGDELRELALVRKTLLRMSAWMHFLVPVV